MLRHRSPQPSLILLSTDTLSLDRLEVILQRGVFFLCFVESSLGLRPFLFERLHLRLRGLEPPRAGKCARTTRGRTTRHRAACLNDLSVERNNSEAVPIGTGKRERRVHIF